MFLLINHRLTIVNRWIELKNTNHFLKKKKTTIFSKGCLKNKKIKTIPLIFANKNLHLPTFFCVAIYLAKKTVLVTKFIFLVLIFIFVVESKFVVVDCFILVIQFT